MPSTTANRTVDELCKLFSSYGLPEQIVMDNGPQFVSEEFVTFTKMNGMKHIKSASYHPSTNGVVERLVQTFKKAMKASEHKGRTYSQQLASFTDLHLMPLLIKLLYSKLLLKRKLRTRMDMIKLM